MLSKETIEEFRQSTKKNTTRIFKMKRHLKLAWTFWIWWMSSIGQSRKNGLRN